jgi:histidine triad (HIT) family protein
MADCIFCQLIAGERRPHAVYEDGHVLAFLDIHPASRGHTLVIPKVHAERLDLLEDLHVGSLFTGVKAVMGLLEAALKPAGLNVGWNHGWAAGQRVNHLHVHVIPRYPGDGGGGIQSLIHSFVTEDLNSVAAQIRSVAGKAN